MTGTASSVDSIFLVSTLTLLSKCCRWWQKRLSNWFSQWWQWQGLWWFSFRRRSMNDYRRCLTTAGHCSSNYRSSFSRHGLRDKENFFILRSLCLGWRCQGCPLRRWQVRSLMRGLIEWFFDRWWCFQLFFILLMSLFSVWRSLPPQEKETIAPEARITEPVALNDEDECLSVSQSLTILFSYSLNIKGIRQTVKYRQSHSTARWKKVESESQSNLTQVMVQKEKVKEMQKLRKLQLKYVWRKDW